MRGALLGNRGERREDVDVSVETQLTNKARQPFSLQLAYVAPSGSIIVTSASLTTAPARRFGLRKEGQVASGMYADLVLLGGDPSVDGRAFTAVRYTLRAGKVIYRSPSP